jgi:hypothetical protein
MASETAKPGSDPQPAKDAQDPYADLPAGNLPPVPKWTVVAAFALWAGWLIFLLVIR